MRLANLNRLIAEATKPYNNPLDLLAEHLNAARRCLLSNSDLEYRMSLLEAGKALSCVAQQDDRERIRHSMLLLLQPAK